MKKNIKLPAFNKSFKLEIFIGLVAVAIIPVLLTSILLVNLFKARLNRDYEEEAQNQMYLVSVSLENYFVNIEQTFRRIIADHRITDSIYDADEELSRLAYSRLYFITEGIRNTADFNVYDKNGRCIYTTKSYTAVASMPTYWGILKVAYTHPEKMIIKHNVMAGNNKLVLQTACSIFNEEECIGFVVADISSDNIESVINTTYDESNGVSILDSFYEELYSTKIGARENIARLIRERIFSGEKLKQKNDRVVFFVRDIGTTGLVLVLGKEPVLTDDITRTMLGVIFLIGALSFFFCIMVATFFSNLLSVPLNKMTEVMKKVRSGNLNVKINSKRQDEFGQLSNQFDKMTTELSEYMTLQVRHQQELNDSNIAMMQAQLNPHFLYNTLDTIKWGAKANGVPKLANMAAGLAQILRMSISETRFITIKQELELVQKYIEIQQIRFGDNFTYDVELPMELEECLVPKLIIQPIVENALIHGLKEKEDGEIFVNIYQESAVLHIEVSDNGKGMLDEIMEKINSRDRQQLVGHIGFYNVDTIIRLYYGDKYGLLAKKLEEGRTLVSITLPLEKTGETAAAVEIKEDW